MPGVIYDDALDHGANAEQFRNASWIGLIVVRQFKHA